MDALLRIIMIPISLNSIALDAEDRKPDSTEFVSGFMATHDHPPRYHLHQFHNFCAPEPRPSSGVIPREATFSDITKGTRIVKPLQLGQRYDFTDRMLDGCM